MANYNALEALINAYIKQNGVKAITGQVLNGVLRGMVSALGKGWTIAEGDARPDTDPGTMTGPVAYVAHTAGTYTNFGGLVVNEGEVALLKYNEQTWTKEVLASLAANATIDGNVGTPAVGVSFVNGVLTFDFRNMKGNPGDSAGFGTVNATVDGTIGTPGVTVQTSGPDTAKNFTFAFTGLKGETGVTSVVASVDNTTGNPSCSVSLVGQELHLDFTGLKGAQGDTGVSANYPIAIVNNLTTNDPASALSAAQGVVLDGKVSQLEAKVTAERIPFAPGKNLLDMRGSISGYLDSSGGFVSNSSFHITRYIELQPSTGYCARKNDNDHIGGGSTYHCFYDSSFNFISSVLSSSTTFTTPATAKYARFTVRDTTLTKEPMVNVGSQRGTYEPYSPIYDYTATIRGDISKIQDEYVKEAYGKNLLDIKDISVGFIYGNGSLNNNNDSFRKTGFIPVEASTTYFLSDETKKVQGSGVPIFAFYDADKNYIGKQDWNTSEPTGIAITTIADTAFVRLTLYTDSVNDNLQFEKGASRTTYQPFSPIYGYNEGIYEQIAKTTPAQFSVGTSGKGASVASLSNDVLVVADFPQYIKTSGIVSAGGKITQFNEIAVGYNYAHGMGRYIKVNATNIVLCRTNYSGTEYTIETVPHNLTITEFIDVVLVIDGYNLTAIVSTLGGYKKYTHTYNDADANNGYVESMSGYPTIHADANTNLTDVKITTTCADFKRPVWVFGDSYCSQNNERWPYYARYQMGAKALWVGLSGGQSSHLFADLVKALNFGSPKFLVWMLGMNDSAANYEAYYEKVKGICEENGATLIITTIPIIPSFTTKNAEINTFVENSGTRYIDSNSAVGADENGDWYDGCLFTDNVHPTAKGAMCLFAGVLEAFPELLQ